MTVGQGNGGTSQAPAGGLSPSGGNQPSIGIQGVVSKSADKSVKVYNGRTKYNEWAFIHVATSQQAGVTTGQGRNPNQNPNQQSPQSQNPFMSPGSNRPGIPNGPGFGQQQQPPPPGGRSLFGPATPPKGQ